MEELEVIQYPQIAGLNVFVNTVLYRAPHFHQEWELMWLLDAPLKVRSTRGTQILLPGDVAVFPPNDTHELWQTEGACTFLCIQISPALFPSIAGWTLDCLSLREAVSEAELTRLCRTMLEIARAYLERETHYELLCCGQAALLLHRLLTLLPCRRLSAEESAGIARQNARLRRLVEFVENNCTHKIRLADFAAQEGCSVSYLSHFIRDSLNQTFQEYVNSVRFSLACKLIAEGRESMLSICNAAGFSDYRYFSRAFRRAFGMTPAEYSRQEQVLPDPELHSRSFQSRERLLTRNQSLFLLRKFRDSLTRT